MNRFDIAVILVTFAILGVAAVIRGIVVPVVRFRVRQRLAGGPLARDDKDQLQ